MTVVHEPVTITVRPVAGHIGAEGLSPAVQAFADGLRAEHRYAGPDSGLSRESALVAGPPFTGKHVVVDD